ncbi:MAG: AraC family transcriptional regulator [Chitinophagaceae bacterium]|nr:MAG: AraC family transcriptional regulator [Chitinophagaceae bacterium]
MKASAPATSIEDFYRHAAGLTGKEAAELLPPGMQQDVGHFNVFDNADMYRKVRAGAQMPYDRRAYYKISLIRGRSRAEYADRVIPIGRNALLFATPQVPYHYVPEGEVLDGHFCIFSAAFLVKSRSGVDPSGLPIFRPGAYPVFELSDDDTEELAGLFRKMKREIASDYPYKYDLLRTYVLELIHFGQKLQPLPAAPATANASARVASLFAELLERQFPLDAPGRQLELRAPKHFADRLSVHVNHLNKALKEHTGQTTTALIASRIAQEAKILLRHTGWNVSEIAWSLGFEEVAHFSNFFKKQAGAAPLAFRSATI